MLWDIIRDWFVQYVWGGTLSNGNMDGLMVGSNNDGTHDTSTLMFSVGGNNELCMGDWLATTSTIIVLVLMCVFLFLVVRYLFRLTSGLIRGR